jgi:hypothetical protein
MFFSFPFELKAVLRLSCKPTRERVYRLPHTVHMLMLSKGDVCQCVAGVRLPQDPLDPQTVVLAPHSGFFYRVFFSCDARLEMLPKSIPQHKSNPGVCLLSIVLPAASESPSPWPSSYYFAKYFILHERLKHPNKSLLASEHHLFSFPGVVPVLTRCSIHPRPVCLYHSIFSSATHPCSPPPRYSALLFAEWK